MASIAILGGGISGLTAAYFLKKAGIPFTLFEASDYIGGKIKTTRSNDYLIEHGPNSLQSTTPLLNQIIEETGLSTHQIYAHDRAKKRFVVKHGIPTPLPMTPPALLKSGFFSFSSKLGLIKEPLIAAKKTAGTTTPEEESVASFVKRRLGQEFLDYALDPFVTGIFAGNPAELSLKHAFPALYKIEQEYGSLLKGLLANKRKAKAAQTPARRIFSFTEGMQMLPKAIAESFKDDIRLSTSVVDISSHENAWQIKTETASGAEPYHTEIHHYDAVLSSLPLPALKNCIQSLQFDMAPLWQVSYPPVTVMTLGFHRDDVSHALDGFGMLVPSKESSTRILGTIFSSTIFPNRAPADHVLLTTLVGGARKADLCNLPDNLLIDFVLDDLHQLLGIHGNPTFVRQIEWPAAIPQYNLSYGQVKQTIDDIENRHPGLFFAGNYQCGISVGDAVKSGYLAAQNITQHFS
ncbi:MAG: protoporphyrinogen oxidase [Rhodothermales bacterium]